jgi:GntR family transcriptional regulator / MocR family aminotransferase
LQDIACDAQFVRRGEQIATAFLIQPRVAGGIDIDHGLRHASDAKLAVVTPGQQAPLGPTLSLERRLKLLDWAAASGVWVIEDDYLSELQLAGRAALALASLDRAGRVIHIGSFSKTISPTPRLGFIVAPIDLMARFAEVAACLASPPGPSVQLATAEFMREGHYLRHLRRAKRAYSAKREDLLAQLRPDFDADSVKATGLAVLLGCPMARPISPLRARCWLSACFRLRSRPGMPLWRPASLDPCRALRHRPQRDSRDPATAWSISSGVSAESLMRRG